MDTEMTLFVCQKCKVEIRAIAGLPGKEQRCWLCKEAMVPADENELSDSEYQLSDPDELPDKPSRLLDSATPTNSKTATKRERSESTPASESNGRSQHAGQIHLDLTNRGQWLKEMLSFLFDFKVLVHLVILSIGYAIAIWWGRSQVIYFNDEEKLNQIIGFGMFTITIPAFLILAMLTFATSGCILERTAERKKMITSWPSFDPGSILTHSSLYLSSFVIAAMPGLIAFTVLSSFGLNLVGIAVCVIAMIIIFPFVLLSVIRNQQMFNPYSADIINSLSRFKTAWLKFYLRTFIFLAVLLGATALLLLSSPYVPAVVAVVWVLLTFVYFRLLGYLCAEVFGDIEG